MAVARQHQPMRGTAHRSPLHWAAQARQPADLPGFRVNGDAMPFRIDHQHHALTDLDELMSASRPVTHLPHDHAAHHIETGQAPAFIGDVGSSRHHRGPATHQATGCRLPAQRSRIGIHADDTAVVAGGDQRPMTDIACRTPRRPPGMFVRPQPAPAPPVHGNQTTARASIVPLRGVYEQAPVCEIQIRCRVHARILAPSPDWLSGRRIEAGHGTVVAPVHKAAFSRLQQLDDPFKRFRQAGVTPEDAAVGSIVLPHPRMIVGHEHRIVGDNRHALPSARPPVVEPMPPPEGLADEIGVLAFHRQRPGVEAIPRQADIMPPI